LNQANRVNRLVVLSLEPPPLRARSVVNIYGSACADWQNPAISALIHSKNGFEVTLCRERSPRFFDLYRDENSADAELSWKNLSQIP
jgi:hypothetical protein